MSKTIPTGVPHSDGMTDEMLAEAEAWLDKGLRDFGAEIFEHSPAPGWLYHAMVEIKRRHIVDSTFRQQAAIAAMHGMFAATEPERGFHSVSDVARWAWDYADALMAEGEKRNGN